MVDAFGLWYFLTLQIISVKILSFILTVFFVLSCTPESRKSNSGNLFSSPINDEKKPVPDSAKTRNKAEEALQFAKKKNFSTDFCILIDMSLHSGVKGFSSGILRKIKLLRNTWWVTGAGTIHGAGTARKTGRNSATKTEAICLHWENTSFRNVVTAIGEFM